MLFQIPICFVNIFGIINSEAKTSNLFTVLSTGTRIWEWLSYFLSSHCKSIPEKLSPPRRSGSCSRPSGSCGCTFAGKWNTGFRGVLILGN